MAQTYSAMKDIILDALTKPAIKQDLYNVVADEQKNIELREKLFSKKDQLFIADIKSSVYNTLSSINPIPMRLIENAIVAGGCFASLFHVNKPNDYDIFILQDDPNSNILYYKITALMNVMNGEWKQTTDMGYLQNPNIDTVFTYEHAVGYHIKIQYIFTKFKTREELINDFDFIHCCTSMTLNSQEPRLYITPTIHQAIINKRLVENPKCGRRPSAWRIDKFINKGWKFVNETVSV